jgi:hypothetical protein
MMDLTSLIEALDIHRPFQSIFAVLENGFAHKTDSLRRYVSNEVTSRVRDLAYRPADLGQAALNPE